MIKLELEVDDLDYDVLIEKYLPQLAEGLRKTNNPVGMLLSGGMPASLAKKILAGLPPEKKDALAASLLNANRGQIIRFVEETAEKQEIHLSVKKLEASAQR